MSPLGAREPEVRRIGSMTPHTLSRGQTKLVLSLDSLAGSKDRFHQREALVMAEQEEIIQSDEELVSQARNDDQ